MLSSIIVWLEKYTVESVVMLVVASGLYATWVGYVRYFFQKRYLKTDNNTTSRHIKELEEKKEHLQTREFFPNLEFKINVDVPAEDFSVDSVRQCLCKSILITLFECYYSGMTNFIKNVNVTWDRTQWAENLNAVNYRIMENFKAKAAEREIPKIAIREFSSWYSPFRKQLYYYIRKISRMDNHDAIENTNTYLLILELILMNALADMKNSSTFKENFDGIEYNGNIIGENE